MLIFVVVEDYSSNVRGVYTDPWAADAASVNGAHVQEHVLDETESSEPEARRAAEDKRRALEEERTRRLAREAERRVDAEKAMFASPAFAELRALASRIRESFLAGRRGEQEALHAELRAGIREILRDHRLSGYGSYQRTVDTLLDPVYGARAENGP